MRCRDVHAGAALAVTPAMKRTFERFADDSTLGQISAHVRAVRRVHLRHSAFGAKRNHLGREELAADCLAASNVGRKCDRTLGSRMSTDTLRCDLYVYLPGRNTANLDLLEVARVELLRGPLTERLGIAASVTATEREGFVRNTADGRDLSSNEVASARFNVDYDALRDSALRWSLSVDYHEDDNLSGVFDLTPLDFATAINDPQDDS